LETHSEHLLLRLLRRIRETGEGELPRDSFPCLTPDRIAVFYVETSDGQTKVQNLRVDETGEFIDRWPRGFFEERAKELF
jgi:predicted ATPase